jgi:chromosome segregation ATPase
MESLLFEKKQLVQQWKSSLIGMQRRDEALQATNEALQQQIEAQRAVESEIEGYKNQIQKAQAAHDTLNASKEKMYSEIKFVDEQIATIMQERGKLQERYEMLQRSMNQMDVEEQKVGLQANALKTTLMNVDQNLQIVTRERQKLEVGIAQNKSTQATVSKAAKNLSKASEKVQTHIHEKEMEQTNMQNELSRIKVDSLNTSAHNMQLSETLDQLVGELKEKDGLIEKYELEIRQRNDEIEKKMYRVDRLNRKYEQLTSNMEDENTGPLEATLKNLKKEVQRVFEENSTTQREWLAKQTELVNTTSQTMQQDEKNAEYKSKQAIVQQKRIRLLQEINSNETEVKNLKNEIGLMHKDMGKLNELISKNADLEEKLNNSNFAMEISFVQELKEMEVDSVKMESKAKEAKLMKQNLVDEIVEAERQIMLWEKKIQLEKETQAALDPEVGQAEAQSMEKEIHRMKLRLETLQRDQERMIKEMERAITKRESIATRHRGKKHKEGELSHASLQKKKGGLKKDYHTSTEEVSQKEIAIKKQYEEMEVIGVEIEKSGKDFNELEEQANALQNEINNCLYEKQKNLDSLTRSQHMAKRYEELKLADPNSAMATADQQPMIEGDYSDATNELENVKDMLEALKNDYPQLAEVLTRVSNLAEIQV